MDCTLEAKEAVEDLYEPDRKRRRYFTPSETDKSSWRNVSGEEVDAESAGGAESPEQTPRGRYEGVHEWQRRAGEYKSANILLHDLHAQQRHRMIFASPPATYVPFGQGPLRSLHEEASNLSHGASHGHSIAEHFRPT